VLYSYATPYIYTDVEVMAMNSDDFIITPKEDKTITMTIRIEKAVQDRLDDLAKKSNRSRNEIVNMALGYALKNAKFMASTEDKN
jgi:predicted HicB family RNase H-like nuclease